MAPHEHPPRERGDDLGTVLKTSWLREQPPLARGRRSLAAVTRTRRTSYPRRRGDDALGPAARVTAGELPPGAGTTTPSATPPSPNASYPRSRGDDVGGDGDGSNRLELPPLARGRREEQLAAGPGPGAIPARAGTTDLAAGCERFEGSYPRSRRDDLVPEPPRPPLPELPPLARGRHHPDPHDPHRDRATPVGAGTTGPRPCTPGERGATRGRSGGRGPRDAGAQLPPRARGRLLALLPEAASLELPPLARGRRGRPGQVQRGRRATPARAGTTPYARPQTRGCPSYPRSRGDDDALETAFEQYQELPPLARGRPTHGARPYAARRATPARAGTTVVVPGPVPRQRSYPRSRGDDMDGRGPVLRSQELPPLARGRHFLSWADASATPCFPSPAFE